MLVDEAHERSVNTDILLSLLRRSAHAGLRVLIMSATLEADRFSAFFGGAPVVRAQGRQYPVSIAYSPTSVDDYFVATVQQVKWIVQHDPEQVGDVG